MSGHDGFVFVSYAVSLVVIGALILWIAFDHRARKAELSTLDQNGIKRRSDPS